MATERESTYQIRMFGTFAVSYLRRPIPRKNWGRPRSLSIAKYLIAHRGEAVEIQTLTELFYEGKPTAQVLSNLRGRISEIRKALWPDPAHPDSKDGLRLIGGASYRFDPQAPCWIDVEWFDRYLDSANEYYRQERWQAALEQFTRANNLYLDDFLADDRDQEWTQPIRDRLSLAYQSSLLRAAECHLRLGQYQPAVACAQRAREIDPFVEDAYRLEILALAHVPDIAAAARVYRALVNALREIDVEPDPKIKELIRQIERGAFVTSAPLPKHNLKAPMTAFFGRERELADLTERLTDSHTRVVTLLGPGGSGKTRLAIETGQKLMASFRDGVYLVPAAEFRSAQSLAVGIAHAVGCTINRPTDAIREVADYLSSHECLIILDAAEHVSDCGQVVTALLGCPRLKILATSRQRLHAPGEHIIAVTGLPFPRQVPHRLTQDGRLELETSPSYRLFVDRYTRVQPRFRPWDDECLAIAHICNLVDGMPLALEIAASWGRVMTCREIAARVGSFDALADALDGQHSGIHRVFSFSWQMLTNAEKEAALRASTFAASFSMETAERLTGYPGSTVMSLCDKSFIQWEPSGRFRLHEVIRHYLRRELATDPAAEERFYDDHATYFGARLASCDPSGSLAPDLSGIEDELPDIQQAWRWWLNRHAADRLQGALRAAVHVHETFDRWSELLELLQEAISRTREWTRSDPGNPSLAGERDGAVDPEEATLQASLVLQLGYVSICTGDDRARAVSGYDEATKILERLRSWGARSGSYAWTAAMHRLVSGWLSLTNGETEAARAQLTTAVDELRVIGDEWHRANALGLLAALARQSGDLHRARELYLECLTVYQQLGDTRSIAGTLSNLGGVFGNLDQHDEAERYFREARRYAEEGGHRLLMLYAVGNCAFLYYKSSRLDESEALCREALDIAVDLGIKSVHAMISYYLGLIALDRRLGEEALPHLRSALDLSLRCEMMRLTLQVLHGFARYFGLVGESERAAALQYFVLGHPAYPPLLIKTTHEFLEAHAASLDADAIGRAKRKAAETKLEEFVAEVRSVAGGQ